MKKLKMIKYNTNFWVCLAVFIFTTSFHFFQAQTKQHDIVSAVNAFSKNKSTLLTNTIGATANSNFWIVEEELVENEDNTKKRGALVLNFAHLISSLYSNIKQDTFCAIQTDNSLNQAIPLYKKNCIYLI